MTCKDCIHQTFCGTFTRPMMPDIVNASERLCVDFKNKADFVEVPCRCKECEHRKNGIQGYYCDLTDFLIKDDDFCSHGERRDIK